MIVVKRFDGVAVPYPARIPDMVTVKFTPAGEFRPTELKFLIVDAVNLRDALIHHLPLSGADITRLADERGSRPIEECQVTFHPNPQLPPRDRDEGGA